MARMRQSSQMLLRLQIITLSVWIAGMTITSRSGNKLEKTNSSVITRVLQRGWLRLALQAANRAGKSIMLS